MTVILDTSVPLHNRLPLDGQGAVWLVEGASVEVFFAGSNGEPPLLHLATVPPGGLLLGFDPAAVGGRLIADVTDGARLLFLGPGGLQAMAMDVGMVEGTPEDRLRGLQDAARLWVSAFERRMTEGALAAAGPAALMAADGVTLAAGERLRGERDVVWCRSSGDLRLLGMAPLGDGSGTSRLMPMSRHLWLEAENVCRVESASPPFMGVFGDEETSLVSFTEAGGRVLAARRLEELRRQEQRQERRRTMSGAANERALGRLAGLAGTPPRSSGQMPDQEGALFAACAVVCRSLGVSFTPAPNRRATLADLALMSGFRRRRVKLRGEWWRSDIGPLVGYLGEERLPVALLFHPMRGGYRVVGQDGAEEPVDAALAGRLHPTAEMCYATLPGRPLDVREVLLFGLRQSRQDVLSLVLASVAGATLGLVVPVAFGLIFNVIVPGHYSGELIEIGVALIVMAFATAVLQITCDVATLRIHGRMAGTLLAAIWDRLLRLPNSFFATMAPGDLNIRVQSVEGLARGVVMLTGTLVAVGTTALFNFAAMLFWLPVAAIIVAASAVLLAGATSLAIHFQHKAIFEGEEVAGNLSALVTELVGGVAKLRMAGAEGRAFVRWADVFAEMRRRAVSAQKVGIVFQVFLAGFDVLAVAAMFVLIFRWPEPRMATGNFLAFVAAFSAFQRSAIMMAGVAVAMANVLPQAARLRPVLKTAPECDEGLVDPRQLTGAIEVNAVTFGYGEGQRPVLSCVSMKIEPGQLVAIVGPSGCGKSTLMRLLLGWERPWGGAIFYDRKDLRSLSLRAVRRQIGVVLQNGRLMPGSLYENIICGDHEQSLDDAWEAARIAGLEADIRAMPMGMHTILTEGSATLSGGQIQRLMIARAVVNKPPILMFDEATSSLDNIGQAVISRHLEQMTVTRLVIAHRLSTVRNADAVYVLANGQVAEAGTYGQLAAAGGLFGRLTV